MAKSRLKLNQKEFAKLRNSPEVLAELNRRAQKIADAAGEGFVAGEPRQGTTGKRPRAHNVVITATYDARRRQSKENVLQRALNAGR